MMSILQAVACGDDGPAACIVLGRAPRETQSTRFINEAQEGLLVGRRVLAKAWIHPVCTCRSHDFDGREGSI